MEFLCNNCNVNRDIEEFKIRLNNIIVEKMYDLLDCEVIKASQLLDELIYKCVFCSINEEKSVC